MTPIPPGGLQDLAKPKTRWSRPMWVAVAAGSIALLALSLSIARHEQSSNRDRHHPQTTTVAMPPPHLPKFEFYTELSQWQGSRRPHHFDHAQTAPPQTSPALTVTHAPPPPTPKQKVKKEPVAPTARTKPRSTTAEALRNALKRQRVLSQNGKHYLVQVASFRHQAEADALRAQLLLQGFDHVHVRAFSTENNVVWYRVEVGPLSNLAQTQAAQAQLEGQNMMGLIKEMG